MTVITAIVILLIYAAFVLFIAAAVSKKHKEKYGKIFGIVFTVALVALAIWGFLRNVL